MSIAHLLFVRDFESEQDAERLLAEQAAATHSDDALRVAVDVARAEGHAAGLAEGRHVGLTEALDRVETQAVEALSALSGSVDVLLADRSAHRRRLETEMIAFVGDMAERVLPEVVDRLGQNRVTEEIARIVRRAVGSPTLEIRLSPAVSQQLSTDLSALGQASGQTVRIIADPALKPADVQAEWRHGRSRFSFSAICGSVLALIREVVPEPHPTELAGAQHD